MPFTLSPYKKTVVVAAGSLISVVIQFIVGDGADLVALETAIVGFLTTVGVFKVENAPAKTSSAVQPSDHTISLLKPTPKPARITTAKKKAKK